MTNLQAIILGLLQGFTEFLPISSSGHLIIARQFLGMQLEESHVLFDLFLHVATLLAVIWVFRADILALKERKARSSVMYLGCAFVFTAIIGLALSQVQGIFDNVQSVAYLLMLNAIFLLIADRSAQKKQDGALSWKKSIGIGLMQGLAVLPGLSRSGTTIATGLFLGLNSKQALRFSFLLAIPTILAAFVYELLKNLDKLQLVDIMPLSLGFASALGAGLLSIYLLLALVQKAKLSVFSLYCFVMALILLWKVV